MKDQLTKKTTVLFLSRLSWLVGSIFLISYSISLIQNRDPHFPINPDVDMWNITLLLNLVNIQNLAAIIPLLLSGLLLCVAASDPNIGQSKSEQHKSLLLNNSYKPWLFPVLAITFLLLVTLFLNLRNGKYTSFLLCVWILTIMIPTSFLWYHEKRVKKNLSINLKPVDIVWMVAILSLGIGIGSFALKDVPAQIVPDEGSFWEVASLIANGEYKAPFFDYGVYTFPVASSILQSWLMKIFGTNLWGWRFSSVLVGSASLVSLYLLGREWFDKRVGLISALVMLSNPYYLAFSRLGYNNAQAILPVITSLYFLSLGHKRSSLLYFWLAGLIASTSFYTYPAAWLGLINIGLFLMLLFLKRQFKWRELIILTAIILISVVIVAGPRFAYGASMGKGNLLFYKVFETSFFSDFYGKAILGQNIISSKSFTIGNNIILYDLGLYGELLPRGFIRTLAAFIDPFIVTEHFITTSLSGVSIATIGLIIGLGLSIRGIKKIPYAILLLWLLTGLIFLSAIAAFPPRDTHLVTIIPVISLMTALGIASIVDALQNFLDSLLPNFPTAFLSNFITILLVGTILYLGLQEYFVAMPNRDPLNFEKTVLWISWRTERPVSIYYIGSTDYNHHVEYYIKSKMIPHHYEAIAPDHFSWNKISHDAIVFLEWPSEELPETFQKPPTSFHESAKYIHPDGYTLGYAWTNTESELQPVVTLRKGISNVSLFLIAAVNIIALFSLIIANAKGLK